MGDREIVLFRFATEIKEIIFKEKMRMCLKYFRETKKHFTIY